MPRFPIVLTLTLVCVTLVGWLLVVGRSLLLPFIIALLVWYLITALAEGIRALPLGPLRPPRVLAVTAAIAVIFGISIVVVDIVTANLTELAGDAPVYQARLESLFSTYSHKLGLADPIELRDLLPDNFLNRSITAGANALTTVAGSASLVFIYVLFLLLEQSTFDRKMRRLFATSDQARLAFHIRRRITDALRHYLGIKTGVSVLTGLLTAGLLTLLGLPYAALFGFIAFLLNYIPTIGSLTAVVFPSLLSLVYFDSLTPFLVISVGLGAIQFAIGNLVEPRLMGNSLNLSGLVIMLSLSLWGAIWGVTGMVLCVPLTVMVLIICAQFPASRPVAVLLSADGEVGDPVALDPDEVDEPFP
ncbi:MAG: AI-2E family transporter [Stappia sp.]|uniref:AI-2E family transporter n=1 Tax=Stappia sp. TaxID=1870903 RepID=UPI000C3F1BD5|nr:AI-2E family transporter [Stappia sp.]MAB00021.1 AI-2E family transporter [Stappia sp.]MBM22188.1 AI-2E family transporter [Stappia sp.]